MTTPSGTPAWTRTTDHTIYGGHENKANYQNQDIVNPRTDVGAEAITRAASDLAAVTRTVPFVVFTATCSDTSPAAPTVHAANMMTGVTTTYVGDVPPTGFPELTRTGNGAFTVTFESEYEDEYGIEGAFGITHAWASGHGATSNNPTVDYTAGAQVLTIRAFAAGGAALSDAKVSFGVW